MSAPTVDAFPGTDGAVWSFARADECEPPGCASILYTAGGPLLCVLDAAHLHDAFDKRHGGGRARWTDEEAAQSLLARTWTCLYCSAPCLPSLFRGCCSSLHARLEHDATDEYELAGAEL